MKKNKVLVLIACITLALVFMFTTALISGCGKGKSSETVESTDSSNGQTSETEAGKQGSPSKSEQALEQAKAEGKPVLLKFGSGKCIPCVEIEENIKMVQPEYEGRVVFVIVDVNDPQEQNLVNQYGIQTIPTTYFLGKDGSVVNNIVGVIEPAQLKQQLDALL